MTTLINKHRPQEWDQVLGQKLAKRRFSEHKQNAKHRKITFRLTFEQWWKIWLNSGHWGNRGASQGKYVMARFGDKGPYKVGNVKIILHSENLSEREILHVCKGKRQSAAGYQWQYAQGEIK